MSSSLRSLLLAIFLAGAFVALACGEDPPATVLQPLDFTKPEGEAGDFDRNRIVESAAFTDSETLDVQTVQRFLAKTPYGRPSFLETYQSNGVRAADAILKASRQYRINPLVFLVYSEITQGLVGERNYPFPPDRIEYVFRCGCLEATNCLPALAGFDRQVDCLGRALRAAIDEIKANEITTTGWGPDVATVTLDNLKVTPSDDATAALYDRTPRVAEGKAGGTWIFWNVWNHYTVALDYVGPIGFADGRWIGEACQTAAMCSGVDGAICADNYPDGLCTVSCNGQCPTQPSKPESFCARFPGGGYCLPICNPAAPACRDGYKCVRVAGVGSGDARHVCSPEPG
ncbi:MAG: hypothetical protein KF764_12560 [Labilithrix sp.]|nr:hypothetical protein [Labilithrix sp.]MBX3223761.1 hypothetical protein [Labilithrix sp.]